MFTYALVLIRSNEENYPFGVTSSHESAYSKGLTLVITLTFFSMMMLINFFRAVFMDPGYFASPLEVERKIVLKHANITEESLEKINFKNNGKKKSKLEKEAEKDSQSSLENTNLTPDEKIIYKKFKYLCNFNELVSSYPLTHQESIKLREKITTVMKEDQQRLTHDKEKEENMIKSLRDANCVSTKYKEGLNSRRSNINKDEFSESSLNFQGEKDKILLLDNNTGFVDFMNEELHVETESKQAVVKKKPEIDIFKHFLNQELGKSMLCGTCLRKKIERSHHCRMCGKCVLKMDHHCPWLANCIGFRNYKYFLLIHFYGIIACLIITFTYWEAAINYQFNDDSSIAICWFSSFVYFCNFGLFAFLLWLFIVNWKLVFKNATVIENADKERFPSTKSVNIYDLGCYANFCAVFGENPLVWFMPFGANYSGEGLVYPTIYKPSLKE
jgi:hypothetical protein